MRKLVPRIEMSVSSFTERLSVISWECKSLCGYWTNTNTNTHTGHLLEYFFKPPLDFCSACFTKFISQEWVTWFWVHRKTTFQDAVNSNWCNWLERKHLLAAVQKWPYGEQAELLCPPLLVACTPTTIMSTKTCALIPLRIMFSTKNWAHNTFRTTCHFFLCKPFLSFLVPPL